VPQDNLDIYDVKISGFTRSSIYVSKMFGEWYQKTNKTEDKN
jgi:hypothetical protein